MKLCIGYLVGLFGLLSTAVAGTVEVDQFFQGSTRHAVEVQPREFKTISIGSLVAGDQIVARVDASNAVYDDITSCIASEAEARAYRPQGPCRGQVRARTPLILKDRAQEDGQHYLILDNTYAGLIKKKISAEIATRRSLSSDEVSRIRSSFSNIQSFMEASFENADFNVFVKPCGQSNAFSSNKTADITLCSELIHDMAIQNNSGALLAVLLHEYGHSLLNRWGEPGSSEEDMADQFATAMLLRAGDQGRLLLQGWITYWNQRDSRAEAQIQLTRGDTHTLSVQRARNIQNFINYPEEFGRRWNKMLYRHMNRQSLERVIAKPAKADDLDLAHEALRLK